MTEQTTTERTMRADDLMADTSKTPAWAQGATAHCMDDGTTRTGAYGYECWRIQRGQDVVGWASDDGPGYVWSESEPDELTAEERGVTCWPPVRITEHYSGPDVTHYSHPSAPMYRRYQRESQPQPAYVVLDPEARTLYAESDAEIGTPRGIPMDVWHGRRYRLTIPAEIKGERLDALLVALLPLAERVVAGYSCEWDGSNHKGSMTEDAERAMEEIEQRCESEGEDPTDLAQVWGVDDWLRPAVVMERTKNRVCIGSDIVLTKRTGDRRLEQIARKLIREADADGVVLDGSVVDQLREYVHDLDY